MMNRSWARLSFVLTLALGLTACPSGDGDGPARTGDSGTATPVPTYHQDVAPIVARHCLGCHAEGGIGPDPFDTYERLSARGGVAGLAIERRQMPPWMPDPACNDLVGARVLTDEEIATFSAWVAGGMPEGDPATATPIDLPPPPTFEATHEARIAEGYVPSPASPDDYRCFVLDMDFDEDVYLTASTVIPDVVPIVHHVLVYAISPSSVPHALALDESTPGPGYTCFGGPLPGLESNLSTQLGAWVPGLQPAIYPAGVGIPIRAGSKVVMQVHYNLLGGDPEPDRTTFAMRLTTTPVERAIETRPIPILDLDIPAGAERSVHSRVYGNWRETPITISALTAHMHLLGTSFQVEVVRAGGAEECSLDIPRWDFGWQQSYTLAEPLVLGPGDGIRLTCTYDNSADNQPVVNGVQVEPRRVQWGEGTLDEMCLLYVAEEHDHDTAPAPSCEAATAACLAACDRSDFECLWGCEQADDGCLLCNVDALIRCTQTSCGGQLLLAQACLRHCVTNAVVLEGSAERCLQTTCGRQWDAVVECAAPVVEAGTCDERLAGCGVAR